MREDHARKKISEIKKKKLKILPDKQVIEGTPVPDSQNPNKGPCVNCNLMEIERQITFIRASLETKDSIKVTEGVDNIKKELSIIMEKVATWYE